MIIINYLKMENQNNIENKEENIDLYKGNTLSPLSLSDQFSYLNLKYFKKFIFILIK